MRTVGEHQAAVRALLEPLAHRDAETVSCSREFLSRFREYDRVLAEDVRSPIDHPLFDNSQMDGYAVRSKEVAAGDALRVAGRIAAGHEAGPLDVGTAAPIMTGAPVPLGADAVVPIEAATPDSFPPENCSATVRFASAVAPGQFVRPRGSDLAAGELLLPAGTRLGPAQWGVLAASGLTEIPLRRRLRVLVLSTGDELRLPGETLTSGQIFDANGATMGAALVECGAHVVRLHTVPDSADQVLALLAVEAPWADLVLTTGGVSRGAYEVVRDVFEGAGVEFGGVAMQPGGPQGLGVATLADDAGHPFVVPVVAFPGNPVSALVSFELFLRPVLRRLAELIDADRPSCRAPLAEPVESPPGKHQVRRGRLDADGRVVLQGGASSHLLHAYATSTHLVHLPVGLSSADAGDPVEIWRIHD